MAEKIKLTNDRYWDSSGIVLDNDQTLQEYVSDKVLYFTGVTVSATTGTIATVSNSLITENHVVTECVFAAPSNITTDVTWTTASGSLTLNGTCTSATTADIVLVKKDN